MSGPSVFCLALITAAVSGTKPVVAQSQDAAAGWLVEAGTRLEVDAGGFMFPASIAFVPNPGSGPRDALYFVAELRGTVKVVTNDRSVHVFTGNVTDYEPREELPHGPDAQAGLAGICLAPERGYVFVTFARRDARGVIRNHISRFSSNPVTFGLTAGERFDIPLLNDYEGGISHQIGNCSVDNEVLYVGVGDGWQPHLAGDPTTPNGKLLRMGLAGEALPDNPFASNGDDLQGRVYAIGLRNPFGVAVVDGHAFVADNGTRVDRFLAIQPGHDYMWRGSDLAIGLGAEFVFGQSIGPAEMDYAPARQTSLPAALRETFYIAASANDAARGLRPGVMALRWNRADRSLDGLPRWLVRSRATGEQMVAAVGVGPDGIYFAPLIPNGTDGSAVLKVVPDVTTAADAGRGVVAVSVAQLMVESGCVGCHVLDDDYGFGSNTGPALDGRGHLSERLHRYLNSAEYARALDELETLDGVHTAWSDARRDVLDATGYERVQRWIKYRIMEPRFDRVVSSMPTLKIPEHEAALMARYLGRPPQRLTAGARVRAFGRQLLPGNGIGRKTLALFTAAGFVSGALLTAVTGAFVLRRRRRKL